MAWNCAISLTAYGPHTRFSCPANGVEGLSKVLTEWLALLNDAGRSSERRFDGSASLEVNGDPPASKNNQTVKTFDNPHKCGEADCGKEVQSIRSGATPACKQPSTMGMKVFPNLSSEEIGLYVRIQEAVSKYVTIEKFGDAGVIGASLGW